MINFLGDVIPPDSTLLFDIVVVDVEQVLDEAEIEAEEERIREEQREIEREAELKRKQEERRRKEEEDEKRRLREEQVHICDLYYFLKKFYQWQTSIMIKN